MEASKGDQKVQKSTNFFFIVHGIWGAQNDRTVVGSIFGYQNESPKCLFLYILGGLGSKKGKKGQKWPLLFVFLYGDMGCAKWSQWRGEYFWISGRHAKMLIFLFLRGFRHKRGLKRVKNHQKKSFLCMKHGVSNRKVIWLGWFLIITASFKTFFSCV